MRAATRVAAAVAALVLAGGVGVQIASASDPATNSEYDIRSTTFTWTPSSGSNPTYNSKSVECGAASYAVVGGGVILNNAFDGGSPPNAAYFSIVSSAPQYSGANVTYKDSWHALVKAEAGAPSRTYNVTVYVVCDKGA